MQRWSNAIGRSLTGAVVSQRRHSRKLVSVASARGRSFPAFNTELVADAEDPETGGTAFDEDVASFALLWLLDCCCSSCCCWAAFPLEVAIAADEPEAIC